MGRPELKKSAPSAIYCVSENEVEIARKMLLHHQHLFTMSDIVIFRFPVHTIRPQVLQTDFPANVLGRRHAALFRSESEFAPGHLEQLERVSATGELPQSVSRFGLSHSSFWGKW